MNRLLSFLILQVVGLTAALQTRDLLATSFLSNGALVSVDVLSPRANGTFALGEGEDSIKTVTVEGNAHINLGNLDNATAADVAYIFVIDSSGSTADYDGPCGTTLECVQGFFAALHNETIMNGSAKLIGVVDFDYYATITAPLQDPSSPDIVDAIYQSSSGGETYCVDALQVAAQLVNDPSNTAKHTIVIFAGDGLCTDSISASEASLLGSSGAIVHSIAVGEYVDCTKSYSNHLDDIPQNGGQCFSIPDPNALPDIINEIVPADLEMFGSTLRSVELKVDEGSYETLNGFELTKDLPDAGAVSVDFRKEVNELPVGPHKICVRATGEDAAADQAQAEECVDIVVQAAPTMSPTKPPTMSPTIGTRFFTDSPTIGTQDSSYKSFVQEAGTIEAWQIVLIVVAAGLFWIGIVVCITHFACKGSEKEVAAATVKEDLKMEETTNQLRIV